MEARLSMKDRELVAVGASVAAGCIPCTQHHVKASTSAGATTGEITRAIDTALGVKDSSRSIMRRVAHTELGLREPPDPPERPVPAEQEPPPCCSLGDRMSELISIAAAVAVNCPASFQRHVEGARAAGAGDDEVQLVVGFARMIRARACEKMDHAAGAVVGPAAAVRHQPASTTRVDSPCCGPGACS